MAKEAAQNVPAEPEAVDPAQGKGRPTPSRKEAQAARAQPLVGTPKKGASKEDRQKMAQARDKARLGMAAGDERYLTARDKGPQRKYVRDYVDGRTNVGEFMIPVMGLVLIMTFIPNQTIQLWSVLFIWGFMLLAVADSFFLGAQLKKRLGAKFGEDKVQPGYRWYAAMRALQMRILRLPKPQVKRGKFAG